MSAERQAAERQAERQAASPTAWRVHELLGLAPAVWALFHLWEQWPAFAGRDDFVVRLSATSHGAAALAAELLLGLAPAVAWIGLEVSLRRSGPEPEDLRLALAEDEALAERLGLLARVASWVLFGWLLYHAAWLWAPKLLEGSDPIRTWQRLRDGMGTWAHAVPHAVGLTAFAVHLWAAVPRAAVALGGAGAVTNRRALRLSGLVVALGLALLWAQLAGWHAAGAGTVWPMP
jgi:hypothetical protein